jgi:hypothetical protein
LLLTLQGKPPGRSQMNDPHGDVGATTFTVSHDGACDDVQLSRRIGLLTLVRRAGVGL